MTTYIKHILEQVNLVTEKCGPILLFGENIDTGSCIGGLARGLKVNNEGSIRNVGNYELTHCGVGLGILLDGGNAALFVKQLDFMLLGLDQICNTYNFIRAYSPRENWGSFTIFAIVCDQGYQGPQSSFNGAGDISSIANIPIYCLNTADDARIIIAREFVKPGFRIICLSQRKFNEQQSNLKLQWVSEDNSLFKYKSGGHGTIVSYNFTLNDVVKMTETLKQSGFECDLFQANFVPNMDLGPIIESCSRTGKLIVIDDSKTVTKFSDQILAKLCANDITVNFLEINRRSFLDGDYGANADQLDLSIDKFYSFLKK